MSDKAHDLIISVLDKARDLAIAIATCSNPDEARTELTESSKALYDYINSLETEVRKHRKKIVRNMK